MVRVLDIEGPLERASCVRAAVDSFVEAEDELRGIELAAERLICGVG